MGNIRVDRAPAKGRVTKVITDLKHTVDGLHFTRWSGFLWVEIDPRINTSGEPGRIINESDLRAWCTAVLEALDE